MREDRQREVVRSIGHLESLKRQIIAALSPLTGQYGNKNTSNTSAGNRETGVTRTKPRLPQQTSTSEAESQTLKARSEATTNRSNVSAADPVAFDGDLQSVCEDIRRMVLSAQGTCVDKPNVNCSQPSLTVPDAAGSQALKTEIIGEMKAELHAFAQQLMQYLKSSSVQVEHSPDTVNSPAESATYSHRSGQGSVQACPSMETQGGDLWRAAGMMTRNQVLLPPASAMNVSPEKRPVKGAGGATNAAELLSYPLSELRNLIGGVSVQAEPFKPIAPPAHVVLDGRREGYGEGGRQSGIRAKKSSS
ncbi:unnamed protein product [Dibothriocephalus latus]|uniref:Uncharacterized protein n=1 Tax=Dibothriocephalus latus TaxID=60516 RepID=A0A3P6TZ11_DIBLA|nr:unnamed protein product [Dibothriocephalus latus]